MIAWLLACRGGTVTVTDHGTTPTGTTDDTATATSVGALVFDGPAPRNLVVLSIDTLRRDHVGRFDPEHRGLTPFLDGLLAESVVATDALACSNWTMASTACVTSGASNVDLADTRRMVPVLTNDNVVHASLPEGPSLAGTLGDNGYASLLVSANDWMSDRWNASQGFDRVVDDQNAPAATIWSRARDALASEPLPAPRYLHLHFFEPHRPYVPPEAYLAELATLPDPGIALDNGPQQDFALSRLASFPPEQQDAIIANMQARYRGEVRWLDAQLADLWADLRAEGLLDDTLVVFWSDHGEALWEHAYNGHGWFLGPDENDALVALWADGLRPGDVGAPVMATDIAPTVLATFGIPTPPTMTGVPLGQRDPDAIRTVFSDAFGGPVHGARKGGWLLQYSWVAPDPILLHDLATDPTALHDRYDAADPSPVARELWAAIRPEVLAVEPWVLADDPRVAPPVLPPELEGSR
ncbi:MAG: sulfatase-like hydrolase/transferase [Alphaproteobacteria bacterium]|nr:sulfatase-like hydrolase/transferase [Alphaproteobacteria bacterium]MCB9697997.1 sulfatase-like hydrolase/transferase [Alphaproteobacteria bacterium]